MSGTLFQLYVCLSTLAVSAWSFHNFRKYDVHDLADNVRTCKAFWSYVYTITILSVIIGIMTLLFLVRRFICGVVSQVRVRTSVGIGVTAIILAYIILNIWGGYTFFNMSTECKDFLDDNAKDIVKSYYGFLTVALTITVWFSVLTVYRLLTRNNTQYNDIG